MDRDTDALDDMAEQRCPFIGKECIKFRKSSPEQKIGTCSLGLSLHTITNGRESGFAPCVVCPHRLNVEGLLRDLKCMAFGDLPVKIVNEVSMNGGVFDHVFVKCGEGYSIDDFCCVEIQTSGTTGTPWEAVVEMKEHGRYTNDSYPYNFNHANQYQKTMMQQVFKKGRVTESWKKHLLVLLQDTGMKYLQHSSTSDMSALKKNEQGRFNPDGPYIHFVTFTMKWTASSWNPTLVDVYDTDSDGVIGMLGALPECPDEKLSEFSNGLRNKLSAGAKTLERFNPRFGRPYVRLAELYAYTTSLHGQ